MYCITEFPCFPGLCQSLTLQPLMICLPRIYYKRIFSLCSHLIWGRKRVSQVTCENEDEDVAAECQRVSNGAAGSDVLQVNQLSKVYQHLNKKVYAVKGLSVGIPAGEVSL